MSEEVKTAPIKVRMITLSFENLFSMVQCNSSLPIQWAQRSDSLYLTIALPDVKDESIVLTDSELKFRGLSQGKSYQVNIEFLKGVDSKGSTYKVLPRNIQMHVQKAKEDSDGFWPRLLKDKNLEKNQVTIDWDRYVDEDEEKGAGGFDLSNLDGGNSMDMEALVRILILGIPQLSHNIILFTLFLFVHMFR
jgi:hypothetical protein